MPFTIGEDVGPYKILAQVGQGGMAIVYKAHHASLNRNVAIKAMNVNLKENPDFIERFKREARLVAQLDNPHIVPIYSIGDQGGQPYLVLKYIEGQTLKSRLGVAPLRGAEVMKVLDSIGEGLQYAHQRGIIHRDIKPSNILLGNDDQIYLSDFGLAKMIAKSSTLTGDMIVGTPHYMSPEQATGEENLDERADIYSLGVMMYELITGNLPFDADSALSIIEQHISSPVPLPSLKTSDFPVDVERVLLKALSKERSDRYSSVKNLFADFRPAWISNLSRSADSLRGTRPLAGTALMHMESGKSFQLLSRTIVLGRNSLTGGNINDIDLNDLDISKRTSRRHAMIQFQNDVFLISDLNSRNGTFLNGQRLLPQKTYVMNSGDILEAGKGGVKLTFLK